MVSSGGSGALCDVAIILESEVAEPKKKVKPTRMPKGTGK